MEAQRARIEPALADVFDSWRGVPEALLEAMKHGALSGGKRLRPALCLTAAQVVGGDARADAAVPVACALELIHAYSLIHDDLPAMDDDELRRGKPTVHVAYGEADAILAGDALNTAAFGLIARASQLSDGEKVACIDELADAAGAVGMVGGQHLDLAAENESISIEQLEDLARRKTGALLTASVVTGGIVGGASGEILEGLRSYGAGIGLAFQVADDVIDVVGDTEHVGKKTAKDAERGKATFPKLLGIEAARQRAHQLVTQAVAALEPLGDRALPLSALARYVAERTR